MEINNNINNTQNKSKEEFFVELSRINDRSKITRIDKYEKQLDGIEFNTEDVETIIEILEKKSIHSYPSFFELVVSKLEPDSIYEDLMKKMFAIVDEKMFKRMVIACLLHKDKLVNSLKKDIVDREEYFKKHPTEQDIKWAQQNKMIDIKRRNNRLNNRINMENTNKIIEGKTDKNKDTKTIKTKGNSNPFDVKMNIEAKVINITNNIEIKNEINITNKNEINIGKKVFNKNSYTESLKEDLNKTEKSKIKNKKKKKYKDVNKSNLIKNELEDWEIIDNKSVYNNNNSDNSRSEEEMEKDEYEDKYDGQAKSCIII